MTLYKKNCHWQSTAMLFLFAASLLLSSAFCLRVHASPVCSSGDTCLDYSGNMLVVMDRDNNVTKEVSLSSDIDSITLGVGRFYVLTEGFFYAVTADGKLEDKLQIFFTPKSVQMMGGTLLVWKDQQLKFHLKHMDGTMKLEQVRGPLAELENFSAFTQEGEYIYFYPEKIKYHNKQAEIVLLVQDEKTITYIDEKNNIVRRDHDFKTVPFSPIQSRFLINLSGYSKAVKDINLKDLKFFIRQLTQESIRSEVLTVFINHYLRPDQFSMGNFNFLLKVMEEKGPDTSYFQTFRSRFKQLPDNIQRQCLAQPITENCRESLVLAYRETILPPYDVGKIHFLLSNLPLSSSGLNTVTDFMAEIINKVPIVEKHKVTKALQENGQLYSFIKNCLERYALHDMEVFELVEPYYSFLSNKQRQSLFTLLLHTYRDTIQKKSVNGGKTGDVKTILSQVDKLVDSSELKHLTATINLQLDYKIDYSENGASSHILLTLPLDFKTDLVDLKMRGSCKLSKTYEEQGVYTETVFLVVPVADVEALYEVKEYVCKIDQETVDTLRTIKKKLLSRNVSIANADTIEREWSFTNRTILEKLKITPNFIGESLLEEANASPECKAIRASCLAKCSGYNDSNGGFFTNSDQQSCESYCAEAFYHCNSASK